jgi:hypothetical protein
MTNKQAHQQNETSHAERQRADDPTDRSAPTSAGWRYLPTGKSAYIAERIPIGGIGETVSPSQADLAAARPARPVPEEKSE